MLEYCLGTINEMPKEMMGIACFPPPPTSTNLPVRTRINGPGAGQPEMSSSGKGAKNGAEKSAFLDKQKKKKKDRLTQRGNSNVQA